MVLNFGPVLVMGLVGAAAMLWRGSFGRFVPIGIVLAVSAGFYFLVDVPDHDGVYVAWRASHLAFVALAALCGYGLQESWAHGGWTRWSVAVVAIVVAAVALPTTIIDIYNAQDVANRAMGPGFRWTVVLTRPELDGLDWIKRNTQRTARVQVDAYARERDAYYMTAFGERRMAGGLPTGMIPVAKYHKVSDQIKSLYLSASAQEAYDRSLDLCVDYLVIGQPEREAYPQLQPLIDMSPQVMPAVFRNDAMTIYAVPGSYSRPGCQH
jgi:hypothetical protein